MKTVGAFDAKTHLSQYLSEVEKKGEEIVILKRGRKMAALVSYERLQKETSKNKADRVMEGFKDVRSAYKAGKRLKPEDMVKEGRKR